MTFVAEQWEGEQVPTLKDVGDRLLVEVNLKVDQLRAARRRDDRITVNNLQQTLGELDNLINAQAEVFRREDDA